MASGSSSRTARGGEQEEEKDFVHGARDCARTFRRAWRSSGARVVGAGAGACLRRRSGRGARVGGMLAGLVLLLLHGALASPDETNYEASGSLASSLDQAALSTSSLRPSGLLMTDEDSISVIHSDPTSRQRDTREKSLSARTAVKPQITLHSGSTLERPVKGTIQPNHSPAEGSIQRAEPSFMIPSSAVVHIRNQSSTSGLMFSTHTITSFVQSQPASRTVPPAATDIMSSSLATPPLSSSPTLPSSLSSTVSPVLSSLLLPSLSLPSLSSSDSASLWPLLKKTKPARNHPYISSSVLTSSSPAIGSYTLYSDKPLSLKNTSNTSVEYDTYMQFNKPFVQSPVSKAPSELEPNPSLSPVTHLSGQPSQVPTSLSRNPGGFFVWRTTRTMYDHGKLYSYIPSVSTAPQDASSESQMQLHGSKNSMFTNVYEESATQSSKAQEQLIHTKADSSAALSLNEREIVPVQTASAFTGYMPSTSLQETNTNRTLETHGTEKIAKGFWDVPPINIPSTPLMTHRIDTVSSETTARAVTLSKPLISAIFSSSTAKEVADSLSSTTTSILLDRKSLTSQNGIISNFVTTSGPERHIHETYSPVNLRVSENPFSNNFTYQEELFSAIDSASLRTPMETRSSFMLKFLGSAFSKRSSDMSFSPTTSLLLNDMMQTSKADVEKSDYFTSSDRRISTTPGIFTKNALFIAAQTRVRKDTFADETTSIVSSEQTSAPGTGAQGLNLTPVRPNGNSAGKERSVYSGFYTTLALKSRSEASKSNPARTGGPSHIKHPLQQVLKIKNEQSFSSTSNTTLSLHMVLNTTSSNESVSINTRGIRVLPARFPTSGINLLSERTASVSAPTMSILAVHTSGAQTDLLPGIIELSPASSPSASLSAELSPTSSPLALSPASSPLVSSPSELFPSSLPASSPPELSAVSSPSEVSSSAYSPYLSTASLVSELSPTLSPSPLSVASPSDSSTASPSSNYSTTLPPSELSSALSPTSSTSELSTGTSASPPALPPSNLSPASSPEELLPESAFSELSPSSSSSSSSELLPRELSHTSSHLELSEIPSSELLSASSPNTTSVLTAFTSYYDSLLPKQLIPLVSISPSGMMSSESSPSASSPSELSPVSSPPELSPASSSELLLTELSATSSAAALSPASSPSELSPLSLTSTSSPSEESTLELLSSPSSSSPELSQASLQTELSLGSSPSSISELSPSERLPASSPPSSVVSSSDSSTASSPSDLSTTSLQTELSLGSSPSDVLSSESPPSKLSPGSPTSELSPTPSSELSPVSLSTELSTASLVSELSPTAPPSELSPTSPSELSPALSPSSLSSPSSTSELSQASLQTELSPGSSPSSISELSPSERPPASSPSSPVASPSELSPVSSLSSVASSPSDLSTSKLSPVSSPSELSPASSPSPLSAPSLPSPLSVPSSSSDLSPSASSPSEIPPPSSPPSLSVASPSELSPVSSLSLLSVASSPSDISTASSLSELSPASSPSELSPASSSSELSPSASSPSEIPRASSLSSLSVASPSDLSTVSPPSELSPVSSPSESFPALPPTNLSPASSQSTSELSSSTSSPPELSPASLPTELSPGSSPSISSSSLELSPSLPKELSPGISPSYLSPELSPKASPSELSPSPSELSPTSSASESSPVSFPSEITPISSPSELSTGTSPSESFPTLPPANLLPASSPPELSPATSSSELLPTELSHTSSQSELSPALSPSPTTSSVLTSYYDSALTKQLTPLVSISPSRMISSSSLLSSELSPSASPPSASSPSELSPVSLPPEVSPSSSQLELSPSEISSLVLSPPLPELSPASSELLPAELSPTSASALSPGSSPSDLSPSPSPSDLSPSPSDLSPSELSPSPSPSDLSPASSPSELSPGSSPSDSSPSPSELSPSPSSSDLSPVSPSELSPGSSPSDLSPSPSPSELSPSPSPSDLSPISPSELSPGSSPSELSPSPSPPDLSPISPSELSPGSSPSDLSPSPSPSELSPSPSSSDLSPISPSELSPGSSPSELSPSPSPPDLSPISPSELSPGSSPSDLSPISPSELSPSPLEIPSDVSSISLPLELSPSSPPSELSPSPSPSELSPASRASELSPSQLLPSHYTSVLTKQLISLMSVSTSKMILTSSASSPLTSPATSSYYDFLLTKQFISLSLSKMSSLSSTLSPLALSSSPSAASYYGSALTKYSTLSPLPSAITSESPSLSSSFSLKSSLMSSTSSEPLSYYDISKQQPFISVSPSKLFSSPSKPSLQSSQISALIPSHLSQEVSEPHLVVTEKSTLDQWMSGLTSSVLTSRETRLHAKGNDSGLPPFQMISPVLPNKNVNVSVHSEPLTQELPTSNFSQLTTTTASTTSTTTTQPTSTTQLTSTTGTTTTTTTAKPPGTIAPTVSPKWPTTTQHVRTSPPRTTTTTTQSSPLSCNITDRMWVRTVLSIHIRRNRLDNILKQNLPKGLTLALAKALNDSGVRAQIESLSTAHNVTVGYYVTRGDMVYTPSVVVEALSSYGMDRLMADIRQFVPMVQAVPIPAAPWRPTPAISLMLKTVLRFVGPGDDLRSCRFAQLMEERLENAFAEAEAKVLLNPYSTLSVQILSVSQSAGSPAVSLIYVVRNRTETLNGTVASNLLSRLTAELVGYFLFYPPLITAEPLEYHNLNTSAATKDFWVITVIQDVENSSLEGQYQSFASLMEQRLAELFVVAHQQGARFKRATTVGSYTVQMVGMRRVVGPKNPAELTYYVQLNGTPLPGTTAAKILNTVDSQTMALTLGYFVQLQAEAVVKGPSNNLWIIASVLAPIGIVTIIIIIITAVLCHKNKSDFKTDGIGNLNPRVKTTYRRDMSYYHQPVQGFDYAKQHLGQLGADEDSAPLPQAPLPIRDASLSMEKAIHPDGTNSKKTLGGEIRKSRLPSEDGSAVSVESARPVSVRGSTVKKITTQQSFVKEESKKRTDPYDTSSGSLQLISVKPIAAPPAYSQPASSDRSQDSAVLNGEVNLALKQKSDIEHYRNKLRLKAKRKGYYDFPSAEGNASSKATRHGSDKAEHVPATRPSSRTPEYDDDRSSTYVKSRRRLSEVKYPEYRSRQSLNSPSPGGTEMDLLVMRERPRKGIRNSGYDTEPEIIEETNVDGLAARRHYGYGRQVKGHSETSTLSSQPSIDEVRQQMHLLLEEAFSLASAGHTSSSRRHHYHQQHQAISPYSPGPSIPYSEGPTSAPDTMSHAQGGLQWVPAYGHDLYQCSLSKPTFRFTQLPEMVTDSPPPPVPPRTGPVPRSSLRRSSSDLGPKAHSSESSVPDVPSQQDSTTYVPMSRGSLPPVTTEPVLNHSGNPMTAVYAIPASRPGYPGYFISTPPSSYHSPSWMSYPPEPEVVSSPWTDSVPLPGYAEAFPNPRYPRGSPFQWNPSQAVSPPQGEPDQPFSLSAEPVDVITPITLSTSALVQAIRDEVAKLAKKQADMFEFQV